MGWWPERHTRTRMYLTLAHYNALEYNGCITNGDRHMKFTPATVRNLHALAHAAGMEAGNNAHVIPMGVVQADIFGNPLPGAKVEVVDSGVCGFAWISFKGNTSFGRAMRAAGLARPAYPTGLNFWVGEFGQSMQRKEEYARAYAKVLREHGVEAYSGSRMD